MLRKTLNMLCLTLLPTPTLAALYAGMSGSMEMADFSVESHITQPGNFDARNKTSIGARGYAASIFTGYGDYIAGPSSYNNIYLGGELTISGSTLEKYQSNSEALHQSFSSTTYKMDHRIELSFLPGFLITDKTLAYGRLGYAKGNFKIYTDDVSLSPTNINLDGIIYGIGIRHQAWKNIATFAEYNQTNYQGTSTHTNSTNNVVKVVNISPVIGQATIGFIYYF